MSVLPYRHSWKYLLHDYCHLLVLCGHTTASLIKSFLFCPSLTKTNLCVDLVTLLNTGIMAKRFNNNVAPVHGAGKGLFLNGRNGSVCVKFFFSSWLNMSGVPFMPFNLVFIDLKKTIILSHPNHYVPKNCGRNQYSIERGYYFGHCLELGLGSCNVF